MKERLRHPLLRLVRAALRFRSRPLALAPGPLLVVAPHPDDESLGCGGLLAREIRAGREVHLLYLTDGEASHPRHPLLTPAELAVIRRAEALAAANILGVPPERVDFLALPDGALDQLSPTARDTTATRLAAEIDRLAPAALLCTDALDQSPDHEAAAALVASALSRSRRAPRVLGYLVWTAYNPLLLLRVLIAPRGLRRAAFPGLGPLKARAISAHVSQTSPRPPWTGVVLTHDFLKAFSPETEYFLEASPMPVASALAPLPARGSAWSPRLPRLES